MKPKLIAEDLRLERSGREIFHIENLTIHEKEVLALVGPNGAGKSSLLLTLAMLEDPSGGSVRLEDEPALNGNRLGMRRRMAVVFQEAMLLDTTVQRNITVALKVRGVSWRDAAGRARKWLDRFGIGHLAKRPARQLSGGESQRASLARAFALEPEVLFLDEPFAALDYPTRKSLLNELGPILKDMNMSALFVTHDYTEIPYLARRVAVLFEGRIIKCGSVQEVFGEEILSRKIWVPWED